MERRMTDPDKIEQLIATSSDEKDRVFLLVLNNINKSLIANTETIREVSQKLDEHLTKYEQHTANEEALLNKGRGAWKVAAWVVGIVQIVGLAIWVDSRKEIADIHIEQHASAIERAVILKRVEILERK